MTAVTDLAVPDVQAPKALTIPANTATRLRRLSGALLDVALPLLFFAVVLEVVVCIDRGRHLWSIKLGRLLDYQGTLLALVITWLCAGAINITLLAQRRQSIGKLLVGTRIVRRDGQPASFSRAFWLRSIVPAMGSSTPIAGPLFALVNCLWIFGAARRCLHDVIADTAVVAIKAPVAEHAQGDAAAAARC